MSVAEKCPECGVWWRGYEHRCATSYSTSANGVQITTTAPGAQAAAVVRCRAIHSLPSWRHYACVLCADYYTATTPEEIQ